MDTTCRCGKEPQGMLVLFKFNPNGPSESARVCKDCDGAKWRPRDAMCGNCYSSPRMSCLDSGLYCGCDCHS